MWDWEIGSVEYGVRSVRASQQEARGQSGYGSSLRGSGGGGGGRGGHGGGPNLGGGNFPAKQRPITAAARWRRNPPAAVNVGRDVASGNVQGKHHAGAASRSQPHSTSRVDPLVARYLPPRGETPLLSSYDPPPNSVALKSALKGTRPRTAHAASRRVHTPDPMQQQLQHGLHDAADYTQRASKTPPRSRSSSRPRSVSTMRSRSPHSAKSFEKEREIAGEREGERTPGKQRKVREGRGGDGVEAARERERERERERRREEQLWLLQDIAKQRGQELEMAVRKSQLLDQLLQKEVDTVWPVQHLASGDAGCFTASLPASKHEAVTALPTHQKQQQRQHQIGSVGGVGGGGVAHLIMLRCFAMDNNGDWQQRLGQQQQQVRTGLLKKSVSDVMSMHRVLRVASGGKNPPAHQPATDLEPSDSRDPVFDKRDVVRRGDGLKAVHMYGYNGTCGNLRFMPMLNRVVYCAGGSLVATDLMTGSQQVMMSNEEKTGRGVGLAVHPSGRVVATLHEWQNGKCMVHFWDVAGGTCEAPSLWLMGGVADLCFSRCGDVLVVAWGDESRTLQTYRWRDGSRRSRKDVAKAENGCPGLAACLTSCIESGGVIAQGGQGHVSFLQVDEDTGILSILHSCTEDVEADLIVCMAFVGARLLLGGTSKGDVVIMHRHGGGGKRSQGKFENVARIASAHTGPICDISVEYIRTTTVGADGVVRVWILDEDVLESGQAATSSAGAAAAAAGEGGGAENTCFFADGVPSTAVAEVDVSEMLIRDVALHPKNTAHSKRYAAEDGIGAPLRAACWVGGSMVAVGTATGEVVVLGVAGLERERRNTRVEGVLQVGHGSRVLGIAASPTAHVFATAGQDGSIRVWDSERRSLVVARVWFETAPARGGARSTQSNREMPTCCCFSDDGTRIAVGFESGGVAILDSRTLTDLSPITPFDPTPPPSSSSIPQSPSGATTHRSSNAASPRTPRTPRTPGNLGSAPVAMSPRTPTTPRARQSSSQDVMSPRTPSRAATTSTSPRGGSASPRKHKSHPGSSKRQQQRGQTAVDVTATSVWFVSGGGGIVVERGRGLHMHVCEDLSKWVDYLGDPADLRDPMIAAEAPAELCDDVVKGGASHGVLKVLAFGEGLRTEGKAEGEGIPAHQGGISGVVSLAAAGAHGRHSTDKRFVVSCGADGCSVQWEVDGVSCDAQRGEYEDGEEWGGGWEGRGGEWAVEDSPSKRGARDKWRGLSKLGGENKMTEAHRMRRIATEERARMLGGRPSLVSSKHDGTVMSEVGGEGTSSSSPPAVRNKGFRGRASGEKYAMCRTNVQAWDGWVEENGGTDAPSSDLNLQWVYGYIGGDVTSIGPDPREPVFLECPGRNNLFMCDCGEGTEQGRYVCYFVSGLCVVMDMQERVQGYYRGHRGRITCMAIDPSGGYVASAQAASHGSTMPIIHIWSPAEVMRKRPAAVESQATLSGTLQGIITAVSFDSTGRYLMGVGNDVAFGYCIYDWTSGITVMKGSSGGTPILQLTPTLTGFASCGNNSIRMWEHPSLGSDHVSGIDGAIYLATVRPCDLAQFTGICTVPDSGSRGGSSVVAGHPDGTIMVFQQGMPGAKEDDDGGEWATAASKKNPGSRYFKAFTARGEKVSNLLYVPGGGELADSLDCHGGFVVAGGSLGNVLFYRVDQTLTDNQPWQQMTSLTFSLLDYAKILLPAGQPRGDYSADMASNPLSEATAVQLCVTSFALRGHTLVMGTSHNHVLRAHLSNQGLAGPLEVVIDGHTGHLGALAPLPSSGITLGIRLRLEGGGQAALAEFEDEKAGVGHITLAMQKLKTRGGMIEAHNLASRGLLRLVRKVGAKGKGDMLKQTGRGGGGRGGGGIGGGGAARWFDGGNLDEVEEVEQGMKVRDERLWEEDEEEEEREGEEEDEVKRQGESDQDVEEGRIDPKVSVVWPQSKNVAVKKGIKVVEHDTGVARTIEHVMFEQGRLQRDATETGAAFPLGSRTKQRGAAAKAAKLGKRIVEPKFGSDGSGDPVKEGDAVVLLGGLPPADQWRLRRAVAQVVGLTPSCVVIHSTSADVSASELFDGFKGDGRMHRGGRGGRETATPPPGVDGYVGWVDVTIRITCPGMMQAIALKRLKSALSGDGFGSKTAFEDAMSLTGMDGKAEPWGEGQGVWSAEGMTKGLVLSAGLEGVIRVWDLESQLCLYSLDVSGSRTPSSKLRKDPKRPTCLDVAPPLAPTVPNHRCLARGTFLAAAGTSAGMILLLTLEAGGGGSRLRVGGEDEEDKEGGDADAVSLRVVCELCDGTGGGAHITDVKFSPSGRVIAAANKGGKVHLYAVTTCVSSPPPSSSSSSSSPVSVGCGAHFVISPISTSSISHPCTVRALDFSEDGSVIKSADSGGEFAVWRVTDPASPGQTVNTMRPDEHGEMRIYTRDTTAPPSLDAASNETSVPATGRGLLKNRTLAVRGHAMCGDRVNDSDEVRNLRYKTVTCPFGWSVRAIWRPRSDCNDVHCLARTQSGDALIVGYSPTAIHLGKVTDPANAKAIMATHYNNVAYRCLGDRADLNVIRKVDGLDYGRCDDPTHGLIKDGLDSYRAVMVDFHTLKLYKYPCFGSSSAPFLRDVYMPGSSGVPGAGPSTVPSWYSATPRSYQAHSSSVSSATFSCDDAYLVSSGGIDCSLFQWSHTRRSYTRWWLSLSPQQQHGMRARLGRMIPRGTTSQEAAGSGGRRQQLVEESFLCERFIERMLIAFDADLVDSRKRGPETRRMVSRREARKRAHDGALVKELILDGGGSLESFDAAMMTAAEVLGGDDEARPDELWACVRGAQVTLSAKSLVAEWANVEGGWQEGGLKGWIIKVAKGQGGGEAGSALQRSMHVLGLTSADLSAAWDKFPDAGGGPGGGERGVCLAALWGMEVRKEREGVVALGGAPMLRSSSPREGMDGEGVDEDK